jgi:transcriptional regulator GlxA family with amidase domain
MVYPLGWMLREIAAPDSAMARVNLAVQWIRQDFARPIGVERLADRASMSVSAFHRHFKAVTHLSPLQYQKRVRLLHARTLMIANAKSVMAAAVEVGYESATQFSRDYAKVFGLPPSQDARRILGQSSVMAGAQNR